jgi:5-methylthioribose kinase
LSTQLLLTEANLPDYLRQAGVFDVSEELRIEKAGDGNINWVRRATSAAPSGRSLIIKQARPALERFPQYQVSTERLVFEARYFETARPHDAERICPLVHGFDEENRVLILEDLGDAERLDHLLARGGDPSRSAMQVAGFLGTVHRATREQGLGPRFQNEAMQRLHGDHIFALPYQENDFPLPPRTRERADRIREEGRLGEIAARAYERYLSPSAGVLVHGDVQAGNILLQAGRPKLIDAEIAHLGDPAFDMGSLLAHLMLPAIARGEMEHATPVLECCWDTYLAAHGDDAPASYADAARYAGLELLRRTLGAARVPAVESDEAGLRVVDAGEKLATDPPAGPR